MKKYDFDYSKLKGRIYEKYGSLQSFASALDISKTAFYNKLSNKANITRADMIEWSGLLDIPLEEYKDYFFTLKVDSLQT